MQRNRLIAGERAGLAYHTCRLLEVIITQSDEAVADLSSLGVLPTLVPWHEPVVAETHRRDKRHALR